MKNLLNRFGKLATLVLSVSVAPFLVAGTVYAGPPAQSGPNVIRSEEQAWFWYANEEYIVFHGRDVVQECINAFIENITGEPAEFVPFGTWNVQYGVNPRDDNLVRGIGKSGVDVETWIFPTEYFDGLSPVETCFNKLLPNLPHPEIASGVAHVIVRDSNLFLAETKSAHTRSISAQGMLLSPDESVGELMFNGGFHCVASQDITEEKCKVRVNLN